MTFRLIPAIDIIDGQLVRLYKGDYNQQTTYAKSPVEMAQEYQQMGFDHIHVVDLNGAKDGELTIETIKSITSIPGLSVQVGGGVRSIDHVDALIQANVSAVIGSLWVKDFSLAASIARQFHNKIGRFRRSWFNTSNSWLDRNIHNSTQ